MIRARRPSDARGRVAACFVAGWFVVAAWQPGGSPALADSRSLGSHRLGQLQQVPPQRPLSVRGWRASAVFAVRVWTSERATACCCPSCSTVVLGEGAPPPVTLGELWNHADAVARDPCGRLDAHVRGAVRSPGTGRLLPRPVAGDYRRCCSGRGCSRLRVRAFAHCGHDLPGHIILLAVAPRGIGLGRGLGAPEELLNAGLSPRNHSSRRSHDRSAPLSPRWMDMAWYLPVLAARDR